MSAACVPCVSYDGEAMGASWQHFVTSDPAVMHGQACIKGTRIPVSLVLGALADGMTVEEVVAEYPSLSPDAVSAALAYGAAVTPARGLRA